MITLDIKEINKNNLELGSCENPIEYAIKSYYNYYYCNDYTNLKCPSCKKNTLSFHKTYKRNLTYYYKEQVQNITIDIVVVKCDHCSKIEGKQKYHAILPEFVLPYIIYEAHTIFESLYEYYNKTKLCEILERLKIRHKLFYDWLKKLSIYSLSASVVLAIENKIKKIITKINEDDYHFLNQFYENYNHPFFLFKLTCVPLCINR